MFPFFLIPTNTGERLCDNNDRDTLLRCVPSLGRTFLFLKGRRFFLVDPDAAHRPAGSTATARVILSLSNFRACTKARAVGEARSRAVSAQDDAERAMITSLSAKYDILRCKRCFITSSASFLGTFPMGEGLN